MCRAKSVLHSKTVCLNARWIAHLQHPKQFRPNWIFVCILSVIEFLCFYVRFINFHWFCVINTCAKYCCKSMNKQSLGVPEPINPFYIGFHGKNSFGLRTFRVMDGPQEQMRFVSRDSTVYWITLWYKWDNRERMVRTQEGQSLVDLQHPLVTHTA